MIDIDKQEFVEALLRTLRVYGKKADREALDSWYRSLKEFSLPQVQNAFEQHLKHGRFAPRPADIVRRLKGTDDRSGDAKETQASKDRVCCYEQNGARCPMPTSYFTFGTRGYCAEHEQHQHDPAHMQRILDRYLLDEKPFTPSTPHRQRAEYLYAKGGAELVLSGIKDPDGSSWGPYDQRMVDWLERQAATAGGVQPISYVSPHQPISVAEALHAVAQPLEPELF